MNTEFVPKLFTLVRQGISRKQLLTDVLSGTGVGIVALPLAIAFAIASGVPPDKGLVTAVIAGFIISAFGGSRVQIGGPTGAFIVIVYGIVQQHGVGGLTIATFMAGFLIMGMGLARLGNWLRYIPHPLIVGFTTGIALIIFSAEVKDFLGLQIDTVPADFIDKWITYTRHVGDINWYAVMIAGSTAFITFSFHRITTRIPGGVVAIVLSTCVVYFLQLPVETIETKFGEIPNHFGLPQIPHIDFQTIKALIQPAFAIALLGSIESLLSAVVADGMIGGRHRSNMELVAQGAANVCSSIFGGMPATGAIARTATNVKNGGRTPIAGIVHALVLLLIMLFLAPFAKLIPMACLAGILVVVAYNMSEWRHFLNMLKGNRLDVIVLVSTFLLTIIFDLIIAIEIGMVLASFLFMKRMSESSSIEPVNQIAERHEILFEDEIQNLPTGVVLYEINGPLFFGASRQFQEALSNIHLKPKVIILRMRYVPFVDATGMHRLKEVIRDFNKKRIAVILSGVSESILRDFESGGVFDIIAKEHIFPHISEALIKAREMTTQPDEPGKREPESDLMYHLSDNEFAAQFAACTLDPSLFTHEAHLRLAWIHVRQHGVTRAIQNICPQIREYDRVFGDGTKYHETVTVAALYMTDHFIRKSKADTFAEFISEFPRLRTHFKELIAQHYTLDIFRSEEARMTYIAPDLLPFEEVLQ